MKNKIAIAAVVLVIAGVGVAAGAHVRRGDPERRAGRFLELATTELALDAGQRERLEALVAEFQPVAWQLRSVREQLRTRLQDQLQAGQLDAGALKSAAHANLATLEKSTDQLIESVAAFYAQLTPEQKTKVAERFGKMDDWRGDRAREGRGRHGHEPGHEPGRR